MKESSLLLVALNLFPDLGSIKIQSIAEKYNSFSEFMKADAEELLDVPGIGKKLCERIITHRSKIEPYGEIEKTAEQKGQYSNLFDEEYPERLRKSMILLLSYILKVINLY